MNETDFIGSGWAFPIRLNGRGGIATSRGANRVQDAIWLIAKTSLGERVLRPEFGAGINDFVFQPNSPLVRQQLAGAIRQALLQWEPRIEQVEVRVDSDPGGPGTEVLVSIDYRLRATNELFNLVYPLYLQEGAR